MKTKIKESSTKCLENEKIFSFQISTRTGDTVSRSYSEITDTYNSILRSIDKFWVFEIRKKPTHSPTLADPQSWGIFLYLRYIPHVMKRFGLSPHVTLTRDRVHNYVHMTRECPCLSESTDSNTVFYYLAYNLY